MTTADLPDARTSTLALPAPRRTPAPDVGGTHEALLAAAAVVGTSRVVSAVDEQGRAVPIARSGNVSMFRSRSVLGTVRPRTPQQARAVVLAFDRFPDACGLQALSTGRNWGLGSREPAFDDVVTLDLGDLTEIRELDLARGYAVIDPGVTQGQLAARLTGTDRMVNVTNSASCTSIVGNAVERGVGFRAQRVDDLLGLEVVLPDGDLVRVGWWPEAERATPAYPHGLGPGLLPLFLQSDLGIVTGAVVRLLPRPERQRVVRVSFPGDRLVPAVDAIRGWLVAGLVDAVPKLYDDAATNRYGGSADAGEFVAHLCVDGTARTIDVLVDLLVAEARATGAFTDVDCAEEPADLVARDVVANYAGDPTHNDAVFGATFGTPPEGLDDSGQGWLFFLPLVPFTGADVAAANRLKEQLAVETGVRFGSVLHGLSTEYADFVMSVRFGPEDRDAVHAALDRAHELFVGAGFLPYRLDVDHADWTDRVAPDAAARNLTLRLKRLLDPHDTIAPSRYGHPRPEGWNGR
ncbi:FAD-binding oxidoreductase [Blastococcus haudaquaticus]|uniref:4-cresol dehydrogenase (Hydroxylating) n=1 Tax=Blastococcus haudaquaticus TaxID=1938745 RepID=A0A286GFS9_9ACTN|nr:FAD-binding protein [Blastococcus haudaquaticus]SOD94371.1 4-cresol dehydrogenase (hydroxylating) [Blastococcus haudaquaticus]